VPEELNEQKERLAILIVDDEPAVRFSFSHLLAPYFDVRIAGSFAEAQRLLEGPPFDIALVDDRLPEPGGVELLAHIRQAFPGTVRLLMSAWVDNDRLVKAINEGQVNGFLEKPISPGRLLAHVTQFSQMCGLIRQRDQAVLQLELQNRTLEALVSERTQQLAEKNRQLERLATRDPLTGLYNRRYVEEKLEEETARARRYGPPLSVVVLDLDNFKEINDTLGHQAGDEVLIAVASSLRKDVRQVDVVGRIGGEEFIVILPNTPAASAITMGERIRGRIERLDTVLRPDGTPIRLTISGGIAQFRPDDPSPKEMVERADRTLYQAKREGRNRVLVDLD